MIYSYYPGCTLKTKAKELDMYARRSLEALGIQFEELDKSLQNCLLSEHLIKQKSLVVRF